MKDLAYNRYGETTRFEFSLHGHFREDIAEAWTPAERLERLPELLVSEDWEDRVRAQVIIDAVGPSSHCMVRALTSTATAALPGSWIRTRGVQSSRTAWSSASVSRTPYAEPSASYSALCRFSCLRNNCRGEK